MVPDKSRQIQKLIIQRSNWWAFLLIKIYLVFFKLIHPNAPLKWGAFFIIDSLACITFKNQSTAIDFCWLVFCCLLQPPIKKKIIEKINLPGCVYGCRCNIYESNNIIVLFIGNYKYLQMVGILFFISHIAVQNYFLKTPAILGKSKNSLAKIQID